MAHQNIQFIKILYAKINQGKNKTFMHNERFIHTILNKIPHYPVPRVLESLQHPIKQTEISPPLKNNTKTRLLLQKRHLRLFGEAGLNLQSKDKVIQTKQNTKEQYTIVMQCNTKTHAPD